MTNTVATTDTATVANAVPQKSEKVHRLMIQKMLPAALTVTMGRTVPPRHAVIGREKGYVDVQVATAYATDIADFVSKVEAGCAAIGVGFELVDPQPSLTEKGYHLAFTNAVLREQYDWGARGFGKAARAFKDALASSVAVVEPVAPAAEVTLDTSANKPKAKANKAKGPAKSKKARR